MSAACRRRCRARIPPPIAPPSSRSTGFNRSLAIDGRAHGIASSIFHPGIVVTELVATAPDRDPTTFIHVDDAARSIVAMADLPDHVNLVEAIMLPITMPFLGRG